MLNTDHIRQIATNTSSVYAFQIKGGVTSDEMAVMVDVMNKALDLDETVNMLVTLHGFRTSGAAAGLTPRSLKAQKHSVAHVERYAVVGAPEFAAAVIETFDKVIPVEARTFDHDEVDAAWRFVGARPA